MKWQKLAVGLIILLLVSFTWFSGCKQFDNAREAMEEALTEVSVAEDTTNLQQELQATREITDMEQRRVELENRLQALITQIEEKDEALREREARLNQQEDSLKAVASNLLLREKRVQRNQIFAWVIFGIGIVGIVLVLALSRRLQKDWKARGKGGAMAAEAALEEKSTLRDRNEYQKTMESKLKEWGKQMEQLKSKADKAKEDVKEEYQKQVKILQDKEKKTRETLQKLKKSSGEAWTELKRGFEKSWKELQDATREASKKLKSES